MDLLIGWCWPENQNYDNNGEKFPLRQSASKTLCCLVFQEIAWIVVGVVERSWTWRRKARFTYITSSGCQLPFTFFGRQSRCYCCFELGSLAMPRKLYWTKKILANALHRLGAQYHVHVLSSDRKIHTHVMFTFFAKLSPWWFAVCLISSLWS